ncbi:methyltransferase domain-containing protein [Rhodoblastus sp. 17X3]|uniref:class I SAM-dependent methyltransferase n=1 Tax=Rhodoblastus sp. 17X3 TaxID=3047026 RepID=UPI0024B85CD8|nr:methyltransferase domain-containing protein [Rhodoblastus sp. 17X3]MDI9847739.1 methyltransferase domain-containing protein [Rhodoblastus sp. 17X3]
MANPLISQKISRQSFGAIDRSRVSISHQLLHIHWSITPMNERFSEIYEKNEWGYGSGVGSLPLNNVEYLRFLKVFLNRNKIGSVIDFGCGDWQFSRFIDWEGAKYTGFDTVAKLIERNQATFSSEDVAFRIFKPGDDLPEADLILCKDVFQHLSNSLIRQYLDLFKARAKFLLITNDEWPAENQTNFDIQDGGWRPIRLDLSPFYEVAPVILSWVIEWGGWKPTRKATCLILGNRK